MSKKQNKTRQKELEHQAALGAFITQPISQDDKRQAKTGVALPDDLNVEIAREWIEKDEK